MPKVEQSASEAHGVTWPGGDPVELMQAKPPPCRVAQLQLLLLGQAGKPPVQRSAPLEHTEHEPHTLPALQHWPDGQQVLPHTVPAPVQPATFPVPLQVEVPVLAHATPPLQQAFPHFVVPDGQPHVLVAASAHATPALQQHDPHRAVPAPQGSPLAVVAPVQVTPP